MIRILEETWRDLGRSILVGERYEKNMRGIMLVALLIVAVNIITGGLNLINGYYSAAATSPIFILAGLLILYYIRIRKSRTGAVVTAIIAMVIVFTYEAVTVTHGFTIYWTLLLPLAFCYFANVRAGIGLSLYFLALYFVMFCTPLGGSLASHYSDVIRQRFPLLYLADVILTAYIMVQYHRTTLHQMDNARQLEEAKEAADRASSAKSEFLANMSHEIRTPINAVLGMNEMILRESTQARELYERGDQGTPLKTFENIGIYAGDVKSAGSNLLAIINNILDFSKIEADRMEITENRYQLSSILNDVSNLVWFKARARNLEFSVEVEESLPDTLYGDEVRVRQVITNLLSNAVKYTNEGSVFLSVRMAEGSVPKPEQTISMVIAVRDTGIGIRKEDIDRLFNKFERVDLRHNSTVEGTGLGLAITQALVKMMNGKIRVESEYGKGSVFTVTLPQQVVSADAVGNFRERFEKSMLEAARYRESFRAPEARILIVDDTRMNLTVVTGLLKDTGIRIDTASGGEEALALTADRPYDLILMDQRMPKMDGTEAMRQIRAQEAGSNRKTPVICLTADAIIGAKERYIAAGFTDYLTKPVDGMALENMLMKYLPAEKVQPLQPEEKAETGNASEGSRLPDADPAFEALRDAGIRPETGLGYCQNDGNLYRTVLAEYAQSAGQRQEDLRVSYEAGDWKNYGILVHAVKSTSKMIGAAALSETAAVLETAANRGDAECIRKEHPGMMEVYGRTAGALNEVFGASDEPPEADDILEFLPENDEGV
ncbi:MAG: response regulator [Clostridiales bacterium]|nr:response regulator [Clostridiales bacterium]